MRNWFSNCFPLLYICLHCDEGCICWHFGAPDTPGFYVRAQHDPPPPKKKYLIFIYFLNSKGFYHIASIFDMQINLREGWCEPRWSQSDYWSPPPPPPGPQIAKDVNVSTYEKLIIYRYCFSLLFLCMQCDEIFMTLQYLWIQHMVPQDPPPPQKKEVRPPPPPPNSPKCEFFSHWGPYMKNWWLFYPWILCSGPQDPQKIPTNIVIFIFFMSTQKVIIRLLPCLTCKLI